jgi:hypothetical protein
MSKLPHYPARAKWSGGPCYKARMLIKANLNPN